MPQSFQIKYTVILYYKYADKKSASVFPQNTEKLYPLIIFKRKKTLSKNSRLSPKPWVLFYNMVMKYLIIPSNYHTIINSLKINVGMSLVGVIMGEFLTSKAGLGYLILYGSQVFNLNLVMSGIILIIIISFLIYEIIFCYF